jgi:hypothetical protein
VSEGTEIKPRKFQTSVAKQNIRNEKANAWFLGVVEFCYENDISVNITKNNRMLEHRKLDKYFQLLRFVKLNLSKKKNSP